MLALLCSRREISREIDDWLVIFKNNCRELDWASEFLAQMDNKDDLDAKGVQGAHLSVGA
jgi:hypothetical protein